MEDSFRVRVDKAFGSLASSSSYSTSAPPTPPSSCLSSLWCLTDEEMQRNQWNREKDSPEPEPHRHGMDLRLEMEKDLDDLDEEEEEEEDKEDEASAKPKPDDYNDEEWDIKKSIGLDCTLDYEEEEDEYDKVAVGKEKDGDRLYMSDMNEYGIDMDSNKVLPNSFMDVIRDPRANHMSAKIRLKEDAEAAKKMDSLRVTDEVDGNNLKSILKRKDDHQLDSGNNNQLGNKSQKKRVRFDPECKDVVDGDDDYEEESGGEDIVYHLPSDYPSGIPDYMRNPSNYTHYTLGLSSDVDEESNRQAYMDFLKVLKSSSNTTDNASVDLPKSLTFIPKKKTAGALTTHSCTQSAQNQDDAGKESMLKRVLAIGLAASNSHDNETCAMEEDKPQIVADRRNSSQRLGRHYRTKAMSETDESI